MIIAPFKNTKPPYAYTHYNCKAITAYLPPKYSGFIKIRMEGDEMLSLL